MTDLETDVRAWIGEKRTVEAMAFDDVGFMAREVLRAFWGAYPDHESEVEADAIAALNAMAGVVGVENYARLVGSARAQGNGNKVLEMVPAT